MNEKPLISVIVPVYNCEKYIARCLDSLLAQTYENLEIITIDDGSNDESGGICKSCAETDVRVYYIQQENMGAAAARNTGLKLAKGDWIAFCDGDDYMESDMLEYLLALAEKYCADIAQCGYFVEPNVKETASKTIMCCPEGDVVIENFYEAEKNDLKSFGNSNWCKLFKSGLLNELRFDSAYKIGEDLLFNVQAAVSAKKIVLGSHAKYHYIQHEESLCGSAPTAESIASLRKVLTIVGGMLRGDAARHYFEEQLRNDFNICSLWARYRPENTRQLIDEVRRELRENARQILRNPNFPAKEKLKALLITRAWGIYNFLIRHKKSTRR